MQKGLQNIDHEGDILVFMFCRNSHTRRFLISVNYGGCDRDNFYTSAFAPPANCHYETHNAYPVFMYSRVHSYTASGSQGNILTFYLQFCLTMHPWRNVSVYVRSIDTYCIIELQAKVFWCRYICARATTDTTKRTASTIGHSASNLISTRCRINILLISDRYRKQYLSDIALPIGFKSDQYLVGILSARYRAYIKTVVYPSLVLYSSDKVIQVAKTKIVYTLKRLFIY